MRAKSVLIITNGALCRNPRPLKEADTLGRVGYDVTVLTVRNHAASESIDLDILRSAPFRREVVDLLPDSGMGSLANRARTWLTRKAVESWGVQTIDSLGPARALLSRARSLKSDLTIVHNEVPHWVGTRLLASGRRVAADIEDWHSEDLLPQDRRGRPLEIIRTTERTLLRDAVYTTTTSEALSRALHERYGGAVPNVIANAFPLQGNPHTPTPLEPPSFFWFSQRLGPGRGLETFLQCWSKMRNPSRLVLLGEPTGDYASHLRNVVPEGRRAGITLLPLVPPAELPDVIARHDIGLALEQPDIPNRDLTITNKILQYLNAGLAVVASNTAGHREVLSKRPEAGIIVPHFDPLATASALDALVEDRNALAGMQRAARQLAETTYSWEQEAKRLLRIVAGAIG